MDAVGVAARAIRAGEMDIAVAGGVESMTRAPLVMGKSETAWQRSVDVHDTTIGWRFVNPRMAALHGVDSMPETAENVASEFKISRADQDAFAFRSQQRAAAAQAAGFFDGEITAVDTHARTGPVAFARDEHVRPETTLEKLRSLKPIVRGDGTITAGNSSGVNDGAAALLLASRRATEEFGLVPRARILGLASAGVAPRIMGIGPVPACRKLMDRFGFRITDWDVIELNEAFASQALATLRELGFPDDAQHVNANGGAIALGHPLGMSGARIVGTALRQLEASGGRRALATMCVGVGQGVALALERVQIG
jgi:3-oxoadipyl-CoA thiolase